MFCNAFYPPYTAQINITGNKSGISDNLISLVIASPDVPDLTLIDLPGIVRVAMNGQPENIGEQVPNDYEELIFTNWLHHRILSHPVVQCCSQITMFCNTLLYPG